MRTAGVPLPGRWNGLSPWGAGLFSLWVHAISQVAFWFSGSETAGSPKSNLGEVVNGRSVRIY